MPDAGDHVLARYRLTHRLAIGGTAEVWRATDEQLGREVAVKLLHPHLLPDERSRRRLAAEARAAASLSHPSIVAIYDVDAEGERPALVMQLIDGESLAARLARDGLLPADGAASIGADVADGLYAAHKQGIVHRDVKPGNILLDREGRAHLVDFGIAHSLAEAAERLTLTGSIVGTLRYMAPEQLAGDAVGPRTDLWGLGATLHEALTGRPPYHGATPVAIAEAQRSGSPPMPEVDPALAGVVGACLAPSPADRPLHAGAVADALRDWVAGRTDTAEALVPAALPAPAAGVAGSRAADTQAETRPVPIAAGAGPVPPPYGPAASPPSPRARPSLAWPALVALAAALALGGIAFALLGPRDGDGTAGPTPPPSPSPTPVATPLPTPTPTPVAAPVPGWATDLLDEFAERCGVASPLTAEQLVEMGRGEARDQMRELVDQCEDDGGGRGGGGGGGDDD